MGGGVGVVEVLHRGYLGLYSGYSGVMLGIYRAYVYVYILGYLAALTLRMKMLITGCLYAHAFSGGFRDFYGHRGALRYGSSFNPLQPYHDAHGRSCVAIETSHTFQAKSLWKLSAE